MLGTLVPLLFLVVSSQQHSCVAFFGTRIGLPELICPDLHEVVGDKGRFISSRNHVLSQPELNETCFEAQAHVFAT